MDKQHKQRKTTLDLFVKKNTCMGIFQKVFFHGKAIMMCIRQPPHPSSLFFHGKKLKSKCSEIFSEPKTPKEAILRGLRRKEAMKKEDMGLHTSVPETRTNLC